jgi:predicted RNA binding protein YcfA (HicA-like mRNA interferase family)
MGQKIPPISGKELIKILSKIGILPIRQRGSHVQLQGDYKGILRYTTVRFMEKTCRQV